MRGAHAIHVVDFPARGALTVKLASVPTADAALAVGRERLARHVLLAEYGVGIVGRAGERLKPGSASAIRSRFAGGLLARTVILIVAAAALVRGAAAAGAGFGAATPASRTIAPLFGELPQAPRSSPAASIAQTVLRRPSALWFDCGRSVLRGGPVFALCSIALTSGLYQFAVPVDAHQYADAEEQCHQRSATEGYQRQGHAHHRQDAAHHAHVDEGIGERTSA